MTFKQTFAVSVSALALLGSVAHAEELPGNVQNVSTTMEAGSLTVRWTAVPNAASYNIYYSHESIIGNNGNYDDYARTTGPVTEYTFSAPPLSSESIFVGVLAVTAGGTESEGFETEASVIVPVAAMSSSSSSSMPSTTAVPMTIESAIAHSSTGVLVTFSKNLETNVSYGPTHFLMRNGSGIILPVVRADVSGRMVLIHTDTQKSAEEYSLNLLTTITADDGTSATPGEPQVVFRGFLREEMGATSSVASSRAVSSSSSVSSVPYGRNPNLPVPSETKPPQNRMTDPDDLPSSGIGLLGMAVAAGAVAGHRFRSRKKS